MEARFSRSDLGGGRADRTALRAQRTPVEGAGLYPRPAERLRAEERDVKRWRVESEDKWLIRIGSSENETHPWSGLPLKAAEKTYATALPAIHAFQKQFRDALIKRSDQGKYFWELRSCAYWSAFDGPKIVYPDIYEHPSYASDESGIYLTNTCYFIPTAEKWMTALLNSSVIEWFYGNISNRIRGGYLRSFSDYMTQIPIPPATEIEQAALELLTHCLTELKGEGMAPEKLAVLEEQVNDRVADLFHLTPEERRLIAAG